MGGFTEGNLPLPSQDYPPENEFDISDLVKQWVKGEQAAGVVTATGSTKIHHEPGWLEKEIIAATQDGGVILGAALGMLTEGAEPILAALLKAILAILDPAVNLGGDLASAFVGVLVNSLKGENKTSIQGGVTGLPPAAQNMFDSIMAPLMGLTGAANPAEPGAGQTNAQYTLGAITAVHLHTWIINLISNFSGFGALKFINSFDECVTGSLNARALGRGAMKPYLEKYIATPLTNDLNVAMPLAIGSASQLIKRYLRGNITSTDLKTALRKQGYDDEVVADQLLDAAKLLTVAQVVYLVKNGQWDGNQAMEHLVQIGYPAPLAAAAYNMELNSVADAQKQALADDLLTLLKDHRMERADFVTALQSAGFTTAEIQAYSLRGAYAQEIPKRLSYSQVKALYQANLVDLNYVTDFLTAEGYAPSDADLLVLLEFTKKEQRDQTVKLLAAIRRGTLEKQLADVQAATVARKAALALLPPL